MSDTKAIRLLDQIAEDIRALREMLAPGCQRRLNASDLGRLATLLPCVAAATRGLVFNVRELYDHAELNPALHTALGASTPKQIGKLLRRGIGISFGGYQIVRVSKDRGGALWCCVSLQQ